MKTFLALLLPSLLYAPTLELPARWPVPVVEVTASKNVLRAGLASYYHPWLIGRLMANGERYNPASMTVAVSVRDTVVEVGDSVRVCRADYARNCITALVADRGDFDLIADPMGKRIIDLSDEAARRLGKDIFDKGRLKVTMEVI